MSCTLDTPACTPKGSHADSVAALQPVVKSNSSGSVSPLTVPSSKSTIRSLNVFAMKVVSPKF